MRRYSRSPAAGGSALGGVGRSAAFERLGGTLGGRATSARAPDGLGFVAVPSMGWFELQAAAASSVGSGGRVLLGEGVWSFPEGGVDLTVSGVEFVALSPGRTVFERPAGSSRGSRAAMVDASGVADVVLRGVVFRDASSPTAGCSLRVTSGSGVRVEDCVFDGGHDGVHIVGGEWCAVARCRFSGLTGPYAVLGSGTGRLWEIADNRVETVGVGILCGATVSESRFSGNMLDAGTLSYKGGLASVECCTVGTVVVT